MGKLDSSKYRLAVFVDFEGRTRTRFERLVKGHKGGYDFPSLAWSGTTWIPEHWRKLDRERNRKKISQIIREIGDEIQIFFYNLHNLWDIERKRRIKEQLAKEKSFWKRLKIRLKPQNVSVEDMQAFLEGWKAEQNSLIRAQLREHSFPYLSTIFKP